MENNNATPTDALEEVVETSEDAPAEEINLNPSSRQKALEEIYERRSKEVIEEDFDEYEEEVPDAPVCHEGEDWKTKIKVDWE